MSDYTEAPATRLLASFCVCCGRPLVDATSVELGLGPECRRNIYPEGVGEIERRTANKLVCAAAKAAQLGKVQEVLDLAESIRALGFEVLAGKVGRRFTRVAPKDRKVDIEVSEKGDLLIVKTPFRRGAKDEFIAAWRAIPGRRFDRSNESNVVPVAQKQALWNLLREFFPGKWGKGPKGLFRVPKNT